MSGQAGLLRRVDSTGVPAVLARLVLGGLFIYMGYHKAVDPVGFLKLIREYQMFPEGTHAAMNFLAVTLPWVEILCGALLVAGIAVRGTALLLTVMLVGFTFAVIQRALGIYQAGGIPFCAIKFDCGCGAGEVYICNKVAENAGLLLLSLLLVWSRAKRFALRPSLLPERRAADAPATVSAGR